LEEVWPKVAAVPWGAQSRARRYFPTILDWLFGATTTKTAEISLVYAPTAGARHTVRDVLRGRWLCDIELIKRHIQPIN
jgi:hypothetical protein